MAKKPDTAKTGNKQANNQAGNRGSFKAGQSGNPKGRPCTTEDKELKELDKIENQVKAIDGQKDGRHGPDPAKVFRLVGLGEVAVARIVKKLAERSKSDVVKLRACELAAKVLRMIREDSQQHEGVTVVIQALEGSAQQINITPPSQAPPQGPATYNHPKPLRPGMPVQIIK
jgi:hypothetical protein